MRDLISGEIWISGGSCLMEELIKGEGLMDGLIKGEGLIHGGWTKCIL